MTDSEDEVILFRRRKPEGHAGASTYSISSNDGNEPRRKAGGRTTHVPHNQDPKLLHYLDGHLIVRRSHTPFASGGFCDIFTGHHPAYGKVAMRRPRMTEMGYELNKMTDFLAESEIWKKLNHPNILQFLGFIQSDGYIWAVSRFAENGPLPTYIRDHPKANRRALVHQLADATGYLHLQGVIHGDIKGSNILVSAAAKVLLCDFGLSKPSGSSTRTSLKGAGSVRWCAPELLFDDEATKTFASDVYSFGMTVYEILSSNAPLYNIVKENLVINAINDGLRPPREPTASESGESYEKFWDIASESWDGIPSNRPGMEVVCERLGVTITLPLGIISKETSGIVDEIMRDTTGGKQMRRGDGDPVERATDIFQVVQGSSSQNTDTTDDEIIQKIPRAKAQYNSSLRRGAQRCLQDTRVRLLQMLQRWIEGIGPHDEPIFWLSGEAGTGKSTIAHTIAEDQDITGRLGASFFFSRNEEARRDASLFISTLAYQLSIFDKGFKAHLAASLKRDPTLPEKTIKEQLKKMVMAPLRASTSLAAGPIVVVVDALDECTPDAGAEEILEAWAELIKNFPLRFRLLITSRPSWHIKAKIESAKHLSTIFHLRDISEVVVKADIRHYLSVSLAGVLGPGELGVLLERIGLLFILASTYVKYIQDPNRKPRLQLQALLSRKPTLGRSPVQELDTLYMDIVESVPQGPNGQAVIAAFREVVGAMIVAGIPMTPIQLSDFLEMDHGDVLYVIGRLSSVVFLPDDSAPASFFHQSFSEFLTDPKRCTDRRYTMEKSQAHRRMTFKCLDVFDEHLQADSELPAPQQDLELSVSDGLSPSDDSRPSEQMGGSDAAPVISSQDSEIPEAISLSTSKAYPNHLCYACVYLSYHLQGMTQGEGSDDLECLDRFEAFYTQKRGQWLEAITSLHDIPGLNDLPARLHSGYIKYYQAQSRQSRHILDRMFSFQRTLQPHKEHIVVMPPDETIDVALARPQPPPQTQHFQPNAFAPSSPSTRTRRESEAAKEREAALEASERLRETQTRDYDVQYRRLRAEKERALRRQRDGQTGEGPPKSHRSESVDSGSNAAPHGWVLVNEGFPSNPNSANRSRPLDSLKFSPGSIGTPHSSRPFPHASSPPYSGQASQRSALGPSPASSGRYPNPYPHPNKGHGTHQPLPPGAVDPRMRQQAAWERQQAPPSAQTLPSPSQFYSSSIPASYTNPPSAHDGPNSSGSSRVLQPTPQGRSSGQDGGGSLRSPRSLSDLRQISPTSSGIRSGMNGAPSMQFPLVLSKPTALPQTNLLSDPMYGGNRAPLSPNRLRPPSPTRPILSPSSFYSGGLNNRRNPSEHSGSSNLTPGLFSGGIFADSPLPPPHRLRSKQSYDRLPFDRTMAAHATAETPPTLPSGPAPQGNPGLPSASSSYRPGWMSNTAPRGGSQPQSGEPDNTKQGAQTRL